VRSAMLEFEYYVFWSAAEKPSVAEQESGSYLVGRGNSKYLQRYLDPLYDSVGIGIDTSDDEVVWGGEKLAALRAAVEAAQAAVVGEPDAWPVFIGYRATNGVRGPEAFDNASRYEILGFLSALERAVAEAERRDGYVHIGGGG
jgi:hypothetical protein